MADEIKIDLDKTDDKKVVNGDATDKKEGIKVEGDIAAPEIKGNTVVSPEEGLEKLKKQLETEKSARIAAERRAQEASEAEIRAKTEAQTSQLDLIKGAIAQFTSLNDGLEAKQAEAFAAQDFVAASKINREMADNAAKLAQLEAGKAALEKAPKPTARPPVDPVEAFVVNMTPKSANWIRSNPDYVTDHKKNQLMIAAHQLALARGYEADSDEYFDSIERTLDMKKAAAPAPKVDDDDADPMADAAKIVSKAPPAAPVSRSGNGAGGRPNVVTLSSDEREMAKLNGLTDEEYARNKMALKKEGRLN